MTDTIRLGDANTALTPADINNTLDAITHDLTRNKPASVLLLPPDITRLDSRAGELAAGLYQRLTAQDVRVRLMPALGTHRPMTPEQNRRMFGPDIPDDHILPHRWRDDLIELGQLDADWINNLSDGKLARAGIDQPMTVAVNRALIEGGFDTILSIGQVVPHEVIGMANYTKNILIGVGGPGTIHLSHFLGAVCGMESIMGRIDTPVRTALNRGFDTLVKPRADIRFLFTAVEATTTGTALRGLFYGDTPDDFLAAAQLSQQINLTKLPEKVDRCVVYLEPEEFTSTWLGNKAVYRTRMAIADGGELIALAPALETFGEDDAINRLIQRFGYHGTPATLDAVRNDNDLRHNLSAAAHLIHGSSEGRFTITYATGPDISADQIQSVGYQHADYQTTLRQLGIDPETTPPGIHTLADGKPAFYINKPALGLWSA
ncbi:lactate racemase domain-containing protein [Mucisphaera calidilacus]|uniref:LarA-like N-terminal domain-containing protein n=1 Tax=Mucisphaera calidilacus TaxID=2527982 RepID=A0A518C004_9BACT|nr:lactate racemase domain-containing protein [Mucisphaera calidilacus]QDU72554.1 hypothetical protein Pan265_24240 [Mucisphaera calidilacus]